MVDELDSDARSLRNVKITMVVSLLVVFVGGAAAVRNVLKAPTSANEKLANKVLALKPTVFGEEGQKPLSMDTAMVGTLKELERLGASPADLKLASDFNYQSMTDQRAAYSAVLGRLFVEPDWFKTRFRTTGPRAPFKFPADIYMGAISVDDAIPVMATGLIYAPADKNACFYLSWAANKYPQILQKFGPADLTGLEIATRKSDTLMHEIKGWTRLRELSFFNSLLKALPALEAFDESLIKDEQLPVLEHFANLRSLGLCGPLVSGRAVVEMPLLKRLDTLKLKRISGIEPLLEVLPVLPNIKELWLIDQGTTDDQVEILSNMQGLTKLHILKSKLSPDSFKTFSHMPALKQLVLDRNNWSDADKRKFQNELKGCVCTFEPIVDSTYWPAIVDDSVKNNQP